MPDADGKLAFCLRHCQELSWSHDTAATDTSRPTLSAVDGQVGLKYTKKLTNYLMGLKLK